MGITARIDRITRIAPEQWDARPPVPKSVKIELTGRCNYRCGFCALRTRAEQPKGDMDRALLHRIIDELAAAGVEEIGMFYLGESFMAPELLVDGIAHAKRAGIGYIFLTTNGSLADTITVARCMAAGLSSLKFSVNAADADQFAAVMGVSAKLFERALLNIRATYELRNRCDYETGLYASSIRYDGEQQARMEKLIAERVLPYVDEHYWLPLYSMGSLATRREAELGFRPTAGNQGRIGALRDPLPCWSAFTEGHITADGYLSACCFDADARWKMGDLRRQSFMDAWHSKAFAKLREAHLRKDVRGTPCAECVAYG